MTTRNKRILLVFAVLVLSVSGYWFGYRPYDVRTYCHEYAKEESGYESSDQDKMYYDIGDYNFAYTACLHKRGL